MTQEEKEIEQMLTDFRKIEPRGVEDFIYPQSDEQEELPKEDEYEMVNNPQHYDWFSEQAIDIIEKQLTTEEYIGFLKGSSLKYRMRLGSKPNSPLYQELEKAKWYEERYNKFVEENTPTK